MAIKSFTAEEERVFYAGLPRKLCGAGVMIVRGQGGEAEILIVKPSYKDGWSIPGGAVNLNEGLRDGAIREMIEEIGDCATVGSLVSVEYEPHNDVRGDMMHFLFRGAMKDGAIPKPDGAEIIEVRWVPVSEVETYLPRGLAACVRAGLIAARDHKIDYQGVIKSC